MRETFNHFEMNDTVTCIARSTTGLFIGCTNKTVSLLGTDPTKMVQTDVGSGSIPRSVCYVDSAKDLADVLATEEKVHNSVPVWLTKEGIVMGNGIGRLFNLTANKAAINPATCRAASIFFRTADGIPRILCTFATAEDGTPAVTAMRDGAIFGAMPPQGPVTVWQTWALNTNRFEVSVYSAYAFNSYCRFGGKVYAASAAGVYELGGNSDGASGIVAGISWTDTHFGIPNDKRIRKVWLAHDTSGTVTARLSAGSTTDTYTVDGDGGAMVGRALKARRWGLDLQGFGSLYFLDIFPVILSR
jgi:hypothetical protein